MKIKIKCAGSRKVAFDDLIPMQGNLKELKEENYQKLKKQILDLGFSAPFFVWSYSKGEVKNKLELLDGHQRYRTLARMREEGISIPLEVPIVDVDASDLDEAKRKILAISSNYGTMTTDGLKEFTDSMNIDFDDMVQSFEFDSIDFEDFELIEPEKYDEEKEDEVPDTPIHPVTTKGDVWILGNHRVMCGDSTMIDDVGKLMDGQKADMVHTDPPYNVDYSNADRPKAGKTDLGIIKNDKMDGESFYQFLLDSFINGKSFCKRDSTIYVWHASSEQINFTQALIDSDWDYKQQIIWKKPMLLGRGRYQWAHEPCLLGISGKPWFTDDRTKTTVWDFGGYNKMGNVHPTQKPIFIPEEAISNSSKIGSNVLDLFLGSGSTLIACEKTNRKCFGMELDEKYCDVIVQRWQDFTGKKAILESNGKTFDELVNQK